MRTSAGRSDARGRRQPTTQAALPLGIVQVAFFVPLQGTSHGTAIESRQAHAVVGWLSGLPALHGWHCQLPYPFIPVRRLADAHGMLQGKPAHRPPGHARFHADHIRSQHA